MHICENASNCTAAHCFHKTNHRYEDGCDCPCNVEGAPTGSVCGSCEAEAFVGPLQPKEQLSFDFYDDGDVAPVDLSAPLPSPLSGCVNAPDAYPSPVSAGGVKHDAGKPRFDLLPWTAITAIAQIFTFGAQKYTDRNWENGMPYGRLFASCQRHLTAWFSGENVDPETGKSHLHHAGCCILMLIWMELHRPDLDNRPSTQSTQEG